MLVLVIKLLHFPLAIFLKLKMVFECKTSIICFCVCVSFSYNIILKLITVIISVDHICLTQDHSSVGTSLGFETLLYS